MKVSRTAGWTTIAYALLVLAWMGLEGYAPASGYEDTDNPAVMLDFIREHPDVYRFAGSALLAAAVVLTFAVLAVAARMKAFGVDTLLLRVTTVFGLFAAAMFMVLGAMRSAMGGTLIHIDGLSTDWSEAGYLSIQLVGTQSLGAAGIMAVSGWAVGLSLAGLSSRALPVWLCLLGVVPAFRILVWLLAPLFPTDSSVPWILGMLSIPGTTVWFLLLGVVLLVRRTPRPSPAEGQISATVA